MRILDISDVGLIFLDKLYFTATFFCLMDHLVFEKELGGPLLHTRIRERLHCEL